MRLPIRYPLNYRLFATIDIKYIDTLIFKERNIINLDLRINIYEVKFRFVIQRYVISRTVTIETLNKVPSNPLNS